MTKQYCKYCKGKVIKVIGIRTELHTKDCKVTKDNEKYIANYYKERGN